MDDVIYIVYMVNKVLYWLLIYFVGSFLSVFGWFCKISEWWNNFFLIDFAFEEHKWGGQLQKSMCKCLSLYKNISISCLPRGHP